MSLELEERYSRQVLFRGIGVEGQRRLQVARVAIVGCGATGSAVASLLGQALGTRGWEGLFVAANPGLLYSAIDKVWPAGLDLHQWSPEGSGLPACFSSAVYVVVCFRL